MKFIPSVLIGNMIGGTALFALISYAQVTDEIQLKPSLNLKNLQ